MTKSLVNARHQKRMGRLFWDNKKATVAQITTQRYAEYLLWTHNMSNLDTYGLQQQKTAPRTIAVFFPKNRKVKLYVIHTDSSKLVQKIETKVLCWWGLIHWTPTAYTPTTSQSILSPLGCGGTGASRHEWETDNFASTVWSCQYEPTFLIVSNNLMTWIIKTVLKAKRGVSTGKVHLIKWPVSVFASTVFQRSNNIVNSRYCCSCRTLKNL